MTIEWSRVRTLFEEASQLPEGERDEFLARECAGNEKLHREVASLLAASERTDEFLATPYEGPAPPAPIAPLSVGSKIDDFTLIRVIATGGMGVVYEAEQEEPHRRVALKVMQLGLGTESSLRRFRYEAEILASLRHPSIATIFATGVHQVGEHEVPWFAMELVEDASTIIEYSEKRNLALREQLALFQEVCAAVHYGHLKGVIHRDLKPDNILVDSTGRPRVIDFGVARATDADLAVTTMQTEPGAIIGTLSTMSPEQIDGEREGLDLRTDVYSLGVVLFRMLAGAMPHDVHGRSLPEAARTIREDPPTRPSQHEVSLRGDLETILLKAIEKEPARRYASAAALAEDIERFLSGVPIQARPPSALYQARLFARRHRAFASAVIGVVLVSIVAAVVSLKYAYQAEEAAGDATRRSELVRAVGGDLLGSVLNEMKRLEGATQARAKVAATALKYLDALEEESGDDVELLRELATGYRHLGDFQGAPTDPSLGEIEAAATSYERGLSLSERIFELGDVTTEDRALHAKVSIKLARLMPRLGRTSETAELYREALEVSKVHKLEYLTAAAHCGLSDHFLAEGDFDSAEQQLVEAVELYASLGRRDDQALMLERLGNLSLSRNDLEAAEKHYREQRELQAAILGDSPKDSESLVLMVDALCNSANLAERQGNVQKANELAVEGVRYAREAVALDVNHSFARDRLAWALDVLGTSEQALDQPEQALASFRESTDLYDKALALNATDLFVRVCAAEMRTKQGEVLSQLEELQQSMSLLRTAIAELDAIHAADPESHRYEGPLCRGLELYAGVMLAAGELDVARDAANRLFELGKLYGARAKNDSYAQRQVMLAKALTGKIEQRLGEDETRALGQRLEHYTLASEAHRASIASFQVLSASGHLYRGDDTFVSAAEESLQRCASARQALEAQRTD